MTSFRPISTFRGSQVETFRPYFDHSDPQNGLISVSCIAGTQPPHKSMVKHPYKVHAWGAFSAKGPIGFLLFTGIMDGNFYREILIENLFENANTIMGRRWIFQQDNDPKHTARETKNVFRIVVQGCQTGLQTAQI